MALLPPLFLIYLGVTSIRWCVSFAVRSYVINRRMVLRSWSFRIASLHGLLGLESSSLLMLLMVIIISRNCLTNRINNLLLATTLTLLNWTICSPSRCKCSANTDFSMGLCYASFRCSFVHCILRLVCPIYVYTFRNYPKAWLWCSSCLAFFLICLDQCLQDL